MLMRGGLLQGESGNGGIWNTEWYPVPCNTGGGPIRLNIVSSDIYYFALNIANGRCAPAHPGCCPSQLPFCMHGSLCTVRLLLGACITSKTHWRLLWGPCQTAVC